MGNSLRNGQNFVVEGIPIVDLNKYLPNLASFDTP
jgi:hypothetical protein